MITMLSKVEHAPCSCGRPSNLMRVATKGTFRYYVESACCKMETVRLRSPEAAVNEFQRLRAVVEEDNYQRSMDAKRPHAEIAASWGDMRGYAGDV